MTSTIAEAELAQLCDRLNLTPEARKAIEQVVRALRRSRNVKTASGPGYKLELSELRSKAEQLKSCIEGLSSNTLNGIGLTIAGPHRYDMEWDSGIIDSLTQLIASADSASSEIRPQSLKTGRKETVIGNALMVLQIRRAVCTPGGINFARSGPFLRLCDAIFAAAGIHPSSASAIDRAKRIADSGVDIIIGWDE